MWSFCSFHKQEEDTIPEVIQVAGWGGSLRFAQEAWAHRKMKSWG